MTILDAQREIRTRFVGGFYGQLVSAVLWLVSAGLAVGVGHRAAIIALVAGGFLIFPLTVLLVRLGGIAIARFAPADFSTCAWVAGGVQLVFAVVGRVVARRAGPGGRA